jgi:histidinol-phosphatase (PHP family)
MEDMVLRAVSLGIGEIAFTDHIDMNYDDGRVAGEFIRKPDFDKRYDEFVMLSRKYEDRIRLVYGAEIGISSTTKTEVERMIENHPFEFVIGSVHDCDGWDIYFPNFYEGRTKGQAYGHYFEEIRKCAEMINGVHVIGHLDYIERYGKYEDRRLDYDDYAEVIDGALRAIIDNGKGIEVNTSAARYKIRRKEWYDLSHPQFKIVKRYRELGGEIVTMGSDAHKAEYVGAWFREARECLLEAGFRFFTVYRDGEPVFAVL